VDEPAGTSVRSVADIRRVVEVRFPVYDMRFDEHVVHLYVTPDPATLEAQFSALKDDLKRVGLVPLLRYEGGEHSIYVVHKPQRRFRSTRVNLVLFVLTWITTTLAGAIIHLGYTHPGLEVGYWERWALAVSAPHLVGGFLTFALPLMLILTVHEMGHYVLSRRHGMEASLPFFIPLPPILSGGLPLGTLGAFISMREPMPNRKALLDIGIAGPIAGFIVAIPVLVVGMLLMQAHPVHIDAEPGSVARLGTPLIYDLLAAPFGFPETQLATPTVLAGWVGLFVTAINLFPAGQLDGGHVASALLGDRARFLSYATVALLVVLGLFGLPFLGIAPYDGWLMFALVIAFLGINHPPTLDSVSGVDRTRVFYGAVGVAMFVLCFTPVPFSTG